MLRKLVRSLQKHHAVKRKIPSDFLTVFSNLREPGALVKSAVITGCNVYPEIYHSTQLEHRPRRAIIKLYTDKGTLEFNTSDCDIEIKFIDIDQEEY